MLNQLMMIMMMIQGVKSIDDDDDDDNDVDYAKVPFLERRLSYGQWKSSYWMDCGNSSLHCKLH